MQRRGIDRRARHRRWASAPVAAAFLLTGALLSSCGDDDTGEQPETEAPEATVVADDVTVEADVDEGVAVLRVTAPADRDVGVADVARESGTVDGDTASYRRMFVGGEGSPDGDEGAQSDTGSVVLVRAGETVELPSAVQLDAGVRRVCVEVVDPLRFEYGDHEESGAFVTVEAEAGDRFACVEVDGA